MRNITVVDVACYDCWILCQLEDLPFARLIGIEPRIKNIEKGFVIREILGISTRCEFNQSSISNLQEVMGNEKAEIVLCCGLFHHLASIAEGVAALHSIASEFLFLESICLPNSFESIDLQRALELKDIAYFNSKKIFGITGHKYETSYYDGSTYDNSIVSIASINALTMYLNAGEFEDINIIVDPTAYACSLPPTERNYSAVCLTALVNNEGGGDILIKKYEEKLLTTCLTYEDTFSLFKEYCLLEAVEHDSELHTLASRVISCNPEDLASHHDNLQKFCGNNTFLFEIVKNFRYSPFEKIALEYGKCLMRIGKLEEGEIIMKSVTGRLNADWRAVYRCFALTLGLSTKRRYY